MKITAKNFMSWKDLEFEVVDGVTLIQGFNQDDETPEGSGKSAILNALSWGLYGKIPKDAKIDDVIRQGEKSCEVQVEFNDFTVVRTRGPNDLYIDSGQVHKGKDARETQSMIEELIGLSFDTFCQSIYFAQNYPNKFITANQEDKGKILSEIQDLKQFDAARKKTQELIKNLKPEILKLEKDLEKSDALIASEQEKVEMAEESIERFESEKAERMKTLATNIRAREEMLENLTKKVTILSESVMLFDPDQAAEDLEEIESLKKKLEEERAETKAELKSVESKQKEARRLEISIDRAEKSIEKLEDKLERIQAKAPKIEESMKDKALGIEEYEKDIEKLKKEIENPESGPCPTCGQDWDGDTKHLEKELSRQERTLASLVNDMRDLVEELKENGKDYDHNKKQLKEARTELKELQSVTIEVPDTEELENVIEYVEEEYAKTVDNQKALESLIYTHKKDQDEIKSLEREKESVLEAKVSLEESLELEAEKEPTELEKKLSAVKKSLKQLQKDKKATEVGLSEAKQSMNRLETLKDGYREVKVHVFQSVLNELSRKANDYLAELFEVPVQIKFENNDMKISVDVTINGESRPLGLYSGGQFRRICLAVDLALSDITTTRKGNTLNLRVFDEYMKDLSEPSMEKVLRLLENLGGSTLLIEHNSIFKSIVNNTFEVELVNGVSRAV